MKHIILIERLPATRDFCQLTAGDWGMLKSRPALWPVSSKRIQ
jgi:hypothetical protein